MDDTTQTTQKMIQSRLAKLFTGIDKTRAETASFQAEAEKMTEGSSKSAGILCYPLVRFSLFR